MLETVQEIAIYIHRFHNLDLFQQGWYQIKITIRWEDGDNKPFGTPARVVQYEAPDLSSSSIYGIWRIDDTDNSFSTQPFRIKYARQDIFLCMMISFNLSPGRFRGPPTTAVILKFELMFAPTFENGADLQSSLDAYPAAVHEFRIPPKALLGLHSYCPVHFDSLHAVLVDVSVHVSLRKAASHSSTRKGLRGVTSIDVKNVMLVKALLSARDILLEELRKFSEAIDRAIDISEFVANMDNMTLVNSALQANQVATDVSGQGKPQNSLERRNGILDLQNAEKLHSLSRSDLWDCFHSLGDQLWYLWNIFLKFHRDNKTKILEFLRDAWAKDRKAEWSIWMVYSKVEMPHHYINSGSDESSHHGVHRRVSSLWKLPDDPPQAAAMRAELHRRSIAQMRINNRSIQDMHIFEDPLRIPIVIVERVMNAPRRTISANSYLRHVELKDSRSLSPRVPSSEGVSEHAASQSNPRELNIVVFVHGFQGHHLDLRLVRNQWLLLDPKVEFLMSQANEDKTSGDFREMGQRLAEEVISFLKKRMDKASRSGQLGDIKLSFVGHSIGNVIIRTAIAESVMEPFLRYLHTYVSLSGPHLGYLYSSNSLFNSGLWLLKKLKGNQCIHQLTLTDDPDIQNTFLYKLCKQKTLEHFRHIILLSSPQDGYVPYHSARIETCQAASSDSSKKGKAFLEMLNNCLDQIRANPCERRVFMRCDVNFDTSAYGKNLNSFIGRAAHIDFLESDIFARFIMWSFPEFFR
ncbi:hypothetical protein L6164_024076 [Bauhinia variegata]|uniref:Uncharacterized protein n=1 Tax=Bauhinia variegata TaxID=167791 RepID=A0ACB9LXD2_BAUVA|nr:hypothetical protein L6164_024076 [Bauhinia variegata]